eukprot:CAMPEP_0171224440 /NCGR_PEP_ID=MMETSP0790-20130122/36290_1 /TAXON_ID=2925 /ORGANISM="Alexandrium catenella, Strain OF101" /LENGTH=218 /DNA_ID=CAMNT_0011690437 /DNA_START=26 /DNA_END=682 /DNA_ORIENTATION=-
MAPVHCIALTGGPCGGKSSALKSIQDELKAKGVEVFVVPEVPTVIMQGGGHYPGLEGGDALVAFETAIIQLQLQMERSFATIAKSTDKPSLIVCDRGLLDIAAYLPRDAWLKIVEANGLTEEQMRSRYDAVLHLVTSADGAEKFYKSGHVKDDSGSDVYRAETPEMARELDGKVLECWKAHARVGRIENLADGGFGGKLARATAFVREVIASDPVSTQ